MLVFDGAVVKTGRYLDETSMDLALREFPGISVGGTTDLVDSGPAASAWSDGTKWTGNRGAGCEQPLGLVDGACGM